jgi:hypothetical protein
MFTYLSIYLNLFITWFVSQRVRWTEKAAILLLARPDTWHYSKAPTLEIAISCELEHVVQ